MDRDGRDADRPRQRLGLFTGQFRSDGIHEALGIGTQRRFTSLAGTVFYTPANATDFSPPSFGPVTVSQVGGNVAFDVDITDNGGAANVKRALTLYKDATGLWKSIEMSQSSSRWTGGPTCRDRGRMVHPGGRRIGQRGGHEQQVGR